MKSHTEYLWFNTEKKLEFINITLELERALAKAQVKEGLALASAMHITAGVYINDAEDGLIADIEEWLERLAPFRADYRHHRTRETHGDAHLKNLLVGHQVLVPVTKGKLDLGPWQQVYYAEFDGARPKRVHQDHRRLGRSLTLFVRLLPRLAPQPVGTRGSPPLPPAADRRPHAIFPGPALSVDGVPAAA